MKGIFKRDYEIIIKFDMEGNPFWILLHKGIMKTSNPEEFEMIIDAMKDLVSKMEKARL